MTTRRTASTSSRPKFTYRGHTADDMKRRATQSGSARDGFINPDVKFYTPRAGDNRVRILPPTWKDPKHYGYDIYVHYRIGADDSSYLCLDKANGEVGICPICKERARAEAAGEEDYAYSLAPRKRVAAYVIDRDHEDEGVLLWNMPYTIDRDVCAQAVDKSTGEVFNVDDPESGYDVSLSRQGTAMTTKYTGIQIARRSTPLSDDPEQADQWLEYVQKNPLPDQLVQHDADHIQKVFAGAVSVAAKQDDDQEAAPAKPAAQTAPIRRNISKPVTKPTELSREDVLAMAEQDLIDLIEIRELADTIGEGLDTMPLPELAAATADALGLHEAETPKGTASSSLKERLMRLRSK